MLWEHIHNAGPVATLLLCLSALSLAFVLERLWVQLTYPRFSPRYFKQCTQQLNQCDHLESKLTNRCHGWQAGISLLLAQRHLPNEQRQGAAIAWLEQERRHLNTRLKLLGLMGAIAPLLGLLGTVFGIIDMFKAIAHSSEPVTPALLADGMWTAMVTTALGLVIAIPALAASHGLEQLSQWRLVRIQDALNEFNTLLLDPAPQDDSEAYNPMPSRQQSDDQESDSRQNLSQENSGLQPLPMAGAA